MERLINREPLAAEPALSAMHEQLAELQLPQIAHGRRAIILIEGPEGAGKKMLLRQIAASFDPCHFTVHDVDHDRREASEGHWLARFWRCLPKAGETAIFHRSWYRRVIDDRLHGRTGSDALARSFDEINEFEAQQRDYGTLIMKLYLKVSGDVQQRRLADRSASRWAPMRREPPINAGDPAYQEAFADLMHNSDTRWSPWKVIDADDERRGTLAGLEAIADAWVKSMPAEPPHLVGEPIRAA